MNNQQWTGESRPSTQNSPFLFRSFPSNGSMRIDDSHLGCRTASSQSRDSPKPHLTSEQPLLTVCWAPISSTPGSSVGLTSTRSMATKHPVSWTHSAIKSPSRSVNPPRTGVPVLGAHIGSSASTSKERWMGVSFPMCARAISMTLPIPWLFTTLVLCYNWYGW